MIEDVIEKRPRAGSLWVDSHTLSSIPSFDDRGLRISCRIFAVLVAYMLQHGACGLGATATESVIELVDALGMRAEKADEDHAARFFVDRVHHAELTRCLFRPVSSSSLCRYLRF